MEAARGAAVLVQTPSSSARCDTVGNSSPELAGC